MAKRYNVNLMRVLSVLGAVTTLLAMCACADGAGKLPDDVNRVVKAARSGKPADFAAVCDYPVERPYPLRDLNDSLDMVDYYNVLMDDSLRNVITKSSRSEWDEYGWRGWTVRDGDYIWVDGRIYNIPYVSKAERQLIAQLASEEMGTLPKHLRRGWHPAGCLRNMADGTVYRIDAADDEAAPADSLYRLSVYAPDSNLMAEPSSVLMGKMNVEGSAGVRVFMFRDGNGDSVEYTPDDSDDGESANMIWKPVNGKPRSARVKKAYWRDILAQSQRDKDVPQPVVAPSSKR